MTEPVESSPDEVADDPQANVEVPDRDNTSDDDGQVRSAPAGPDDPPADPTEPLNPA